jgi:hypothetical protein
MNKQFLLLKLNARNIIKKKNCEINKQTNRFYVKFCLHEDFMYTIVMNKKEFVRFAKQKQKKLNCSECFFFI